MNMKEYLIGKNLSERCLATTGIANSIFMEYLKLVTNDSSLLYDKDFYMHYVTRIIHALEGKEKRQDLN